MLTMPNSPLWCLDARALPGVRALLRQCRADPGKLPRRAAEDVRPTRRQAGRGVRVLPLVGVLEQRQSLLGYLMGWTDLTAFGKWFDDALAEPNTDTVLIEVDSPGGAAAGVQELAAKVRAGRAKKKIIAHVNALAASGAYWIASAAGEVVATPSADVGSIGVFSVHLDYSAALDKQGVKPTILREPALKVGANPYEPLAEAVRDKLQADVRQVYRSFVGAVAAHRRVTPAKVESDFGRGLTLLARDALAAGAVDRIAPFDQVVQELTNVRPSSASSRSASVEVLRLRLAHQRRQHPSRN